MPVPLILTAAIALVGRTAATAALKKGGEAALKTIVRQGKQAKMLTKPANARQKRIEPATKGQRAYAKGKAKGIGAGAVVGAGAVKLSQKDKKVTADTRTNARDFPTYKKGSDSATSFNSAFGAAKKKGQKTFTWEGRKYKVESK
tara:strand:+ start:75 stop:509 length:435 start_codon:yes stop_codon:yes gene_type:complete